MREIKVRGGDQADARSSIQVFPVSVGAQALGTSSAFLGRLGGSWIERGAADTPISAHSVPATAGSDLIQSATVSGPPLVF